MEPKERRIRERANSLGFIKAAEAVGLRVYSFDDDGNPIELTEIEEELTELFKDPFPLANPATLKKHGDPLRKAIG